MSNKRIRTESQDEFVTVGVHDLAHELLALEESHGPQTFVLFVDKADQIHPIVGAIVEKHIMPDGREVRRVLLSSEKEDFLNG